jgi:hypothetical protein
MFSHVRRISMEALDVETSIAEGRQPLQALLQFASENAGKIEVHEEGKGILKRLIPNGLAARTGLLLALRQVRGGPDLRSHTCGTGELPALGA